MRKKIGELVDSAFRVLIGLIMVLAPLGILGWQFYGFLRYGTWRSMSIIDAFKLLDYKWAYAPTDWIGLHRAFDWMPLSLAIILVCALLLFAD